jgi:hypothetical protein
VAPTRSNNAAQGLHGDPHPPHTSQLQLQLTDKVKGTPPRVSLAVAGAGSRQTRSSSSCGELAASERERERGAHAATRSTAELPRSPPTHASTFDFGVGSGPDSLGFGEYAAKSGPPRYGCLSVYLCFVCACMCVYVRACARPAFSL